MYRYIAQGLFMNIRSEHLPFGQRKKHYKKTQAKRPPKGTSSAKFRKVFKSITVDNGSEFSDFAGLEKSIYGGRRTSVYYCHPYTSCERGSNERLNREIRRLLPKGTDFTKYSDKQIQRVQDWVNAYPREIFGFATSAELFTKQLSAL